MTRDPIGYEGGENLYAYCIQNPVGGFDADGGAPTFGWEYPRYDPLHDPLRSITDSEARQLSLLQRVAQGARILGHNALGAIQGVRDAIPCPSIWSSVGAKPQAPKVPTGRRVVIGKMQDILRRGAVNKRSERLLDLPNMGGVKANWAQNAGRLREAMRAGMPIRDASVDRITGALQKESGFLKAERALLRARGWCYNPATRLWSPPK